MATKNVIRQDIVQIEFESNLKELRKIVKQVDDLKKGLKGGVGEDAFDEFIKDSKKTKDGLDDVKKGLGEGKDEAKKFGNTLKDLGGKSVDTAYRGLKKLAGISFKALSIGLGAAAAGVSLIVSNSAKAYAEFEQLEGGVRKLFESEKAQQIVFSNANDAYKSAGLSANQYMETVTGFSAALITSLGGDTATAADLADVAIRDMADNANIFGTDMESVMTVYQNLAKQQYTTLDNLKLGYGGTKEGALQLIKDASKIDKSVKRNDLSFDNLIRAIHVMQKEMGIYGTTANEADKTVTGSLNAMKASWENLMVAMATGDDLDKCIDNMIDSVKTFSKNIVPVISKALGGLGKVIEEIAPILKEELPTLAKELLPPLIKATVALVEGLVEALPQILQVVWDTLVELFGDEIPILNKVGDAFEKNGDKVKKFAGVIVGLIGAFKLYKSVSGLGSLFGKGSGGGTGGGGLGGMFEGLKKISWGDFFNILGKVAIVVIALGVLVYLVGLLAKEMAKQEMDAGEILKLVGLMGALGTVGGAIAKIASVLGTGGAATIKAVGYGIVAIAEVIGGMELIFLALGALNSIPGFQSLIEKGGDLLAATMKAIGKAIGALIAGIGEGLTSTLPAIGENLAGFSKSLEGGNWEVLSEFFNALSSVSGVPSSGGIFQIFTGDPYAGLLKMTLILPSLGAAASKFMANVSGITDFTPLSSLLNAIASVGNVPNAGGLAQLFTGDPYTGLVAMIGILPRLGTAASQFMTNTSGYSDFSPIGNLLNALSNVSGLPSSGGFFQLFTGDPYTGLVKMIMLLPSLGTAAGKFFNNLGGITDFTPITNLLNALSNVSGMPESGGFFQFFTGDPYTGLLKMMTLLPPLALAVGKFFTNLGGITDFTPISNLLTALANVGALPDSGGFFQFFTGDPYLGLLKLQLMLPSLGTAVGKFFTAIGDRTDFTVISSLFNALASVSELPKSGGFAQLFTGSAYTALGNMIIELPLLASAVAAFYTTLNGIDNFTKITDLFTVLGGLEEIIGKDGGLFDAIGELFGGSSESAIVILGASLSKFAADTALFFAMVNDVNLDNLNGLWISLNNAEIVTADVSTKITSSIDGIVEKVTGLPERMAQAIRDGGDSLSSAFVEIWNDALAACTAPINRLLSGANHVLKELGSSRRVAMWTPFTGYANGTDGHKGGNALVNDGRGAELIRLPNGRTFIPNGRNVFIPNAPKGMQVLSAEKTAQLMGKSSPTFNYANGSFSGTPRIFGEFGSDLFASYSPGADTTHGSSSHVENNSYAPQFTANFYGGDSRTMERDVKRWISEAMDDVFDSMARKNPRLQEV